MISGAVQSGVWWRHEVTEAMSPLTTSPSCLQWWHRPPYPITRIDNHSMYSCALQTVPHTLLLKGCLCECGQMMILLSCHWAGVVLGVVRLVWRSALVRAATEGPVCHSRTTRWRYAVWYWWSVCCVGLTDSSAEWCVFANHSLTEW